MALISNKKLTEYQQALEDISNSEVVKEVGIGWGTVSRIRKGDIQYLQAGTRKKLNAFIAKREAEKEATAVVVQPGQHKPALPGLDLPQKLLASLAVESIKTGKPVTDLLLERLAAMGEE